MRLFVASILRQLCVLLLSECITITSAPTPSFADNTSTSNSKTSSTQPPLNRSTSAKALVAPATSASLQISPGSGLSGATLVSSADHSAPTKPSDIEKKGSVTTLEKKIAPTVPTMNSKAVNTGFIENKGQWPRSVKFQLRSGGKTLWLTENGVVFDILRRKPASDHAKSEPRLPTLKSAPPLGPFDRLVFSESFVGMNSVGNIESTSVLRGVYNYFIGNDPKRWGSDAKAFGGVLYRNVWDGVDVKLSQNGANIEQEFVVHPGLDANRIQIAYRGIDHLEIAKDGSLLIKTAYGNLRESSPRIYQEISGKRTSVGCKFKLTGKSSYTFEAQGFDPQYALVIDPTILYSTFLGGSAGYGCGPFSCSTSEAAQAIAVDTAGNAYVTGFTQSLDFPTTTGAYQVSSNAQAAFVTKLNALGTQLGYSTYVGGTSGSSGSAGYGIAVDAAGNAYITGITVSGFPSTGNAYQRACSSSSALFFTKLNSSGNSLLYSTCFGQSYFSYARAIAIDSSGRAYIVGNDTTGALPITPGAYQPTYGGASGYDGDGFLTVFDPTQSGSSSLIYSTYFGGASDDVAFGVSVDAYGMAYIAGFTTSLNFPVTPGAFQTRYPNGSNTGGASTGFVAKLDPNASGAASLIYSTYLGGSGKTVLGGGGSDFVNAVAVDSLGQTHLTGAAASVDFPVTPGAFQSAAKWVHNAFVTTLNASGNGLVQSTYLGGSSGDAQLGSAIALDASGNNYVAGTTGALDFPITPGAFQPTFAGGEFDAFITQLNESGSALTYSSYLGGEATDQAYGVAVDTVGDAYITGYTESFRFPFTPNAFQIAINPGGASGPADAFVTKLPLSTSQVLSVTAISPNSGGNTGPVSPEIFGTGIHAGAIAALNCNSQIAATNDVVGPGGRSVNGTFNLAGALAGTCDVVVTNPDGASVTLPQSFTVKEGGTAKTSVYLNGVVEREVPAEVQVGPANAALFLTLSNQGTIDASDGLLAVPLNSGFELTSSDPPAISNGTVTTSIWYVPGTHAGQSQTWTATAANAASDAVCSALWGPAYFTPNIAATIGCISQDTDTALGCTAASLECAAAAACLAEGGFIPGLCADESTQCIDLAHDCLGDPLIVQCIQQNASTSSSATLPCVQPGDPNSIVGPAGVGAQAWVNQVQRLTYIVVFSNDPTATAPAQQVIVIEPFGANVNLSTLSLQTITVPNASSSIQVKVPPSLFNPAANVTDFKTSVDLRPTQNLLVNIDALLNPNTRTLTWTFTSIDPATMQPPLNPLVGFLPAGAGASVGFSDAPYAGLSTGSQITEQASVVFNGQTPMSTQKWLNTVDNSPPVSHVSALPASEGTASFKVQWSGTDVGSGIQRYTVYASDNGGPFIPFLNNTSAASNMFTGQAGHTYGFYSIATDLVGNIESSKTAPEATTLATIGAAPSLSVTPGGLGFGSVVVGSPSASKTLTLTHKGPTLPTLNLLSFATSGDYSETTNCPAVLNPSSTCTITVTFTPNTAGTLNGELTIYDNFSNSQQVINLTGKGVAPVSVSPNALTLSSSVGSSSTPGTVTLTNNSSSSQSVGYTTSTAFTATPAATNGCRSTIPPHSNCTVSIVFTPKQIGASYGSLVLTGAFPSQEVNLVGNGSGGAKAVLTFTPASLTFKSQVLGTASTPSTVTVANKGTSNATISGLQASDAFTATPSGNSPCSSVLVPNAECTFQVTFMPSASGSAKGSISVVNDGAINPIVYNTAGTGILPVTFSPKSLAFAAEKVGTTSSPSTLMITNNQAVPLNLTSTVGSGDYSAVPGGTSPCGASVPSHSTCTVSVTFTPTKTGSINGVLTVTDDASTSPQIISLTGTGQ